MISVMDSNPKTYLQQEISLLESCMIQSRASNFFEQESPKPNLMEETDVAVETRKFKLEIESKFHLCEHNSSYSFPRDLPFGEEQLDEQQQQMLKSLETARYYTLASQNHRRQQILQRLKKSRSDVGMGLFKQALQIEKCQSRNISKGKGKETNPGGQSGIKPLYTFKRMNKDKQNNLNFQNLREQRETPTRVSVGRSKNKLSSHYDVSGTKSKQMKINIPKINLSGRNEQPKCFKDLARLENRR